MVEDFQYPIEISLAAAVPCYSWSTGSGRTIRDAKLLGCSSASLARGEVPF